MYSDNQSFNPVASLSTQQLKPNQHQSCLFPNRYPSEQWSSAPPPNTEPYPALDSSSFNYHPPSYMQFGNKGEMNCPDFQTTKEISHVPSSSNFKEADTEAACQNIQIHHDKGTHSNEVTLNQQKSTPDDFFKLSVSLVGLKFKSVGKITADEAKDIVFWNSVSDTCKVKTCNLCRWRDNTSFNNLYQHWKCFHSTHAKCPFCTTGQFTDYQALADHLNENHIQELGLLKRYGFYENCGEPDAKNGKIWTCKLCGKVCPEVKFSSHFRDTHGKKLQFCDICKTFHKNKTHYRQHLGSRHSIVQGRKKSVKNAKKVGTATTTIPNATAVTDANFTEISSQPGSETFAPIENSECVPAYNNETGSDISTHQPPSDVESDRTCALSFAFCPKSETVDNRNNCVENVFSISSVNRNAESVTSNLFSHELSSNTLSDDNHKIEWEVCVNLFQSVRGAIKCGARRLVICTDSGQTPSLSFLRLVKEKFPHVHVFVVIRPRGNDFVYSSDEIEIMTKDIEIYKMFGADGFIFSVLTEDGSINFEKNLDLVYTAHPLPCTFHHDAFDQMLNPLDDLKNITITGFTRIQTSCTINLGAIVTAARGMIDIVLVGELDEIDAYNIVKDSGVETLQFVE